MSPFQKTFAFSAASLALVFATFSLVSPGLAQSNGSEISSTYTKLNLDQCRFLTPAELGLEKPGKEEEGMGSASWLCPGYNNSIVYVAEGDLRMFVSFGQNAMQERAASQTLPAFNTIGETLEWRVRKVNGNWQPFATILRWHTEIGDGSRPDGEFLIVTKLEPGNTCHVAYINAKLVPEANRIARQIADTNATQFNCQTDQAINVPGE